MSIERSVREIFERRPYPPPAWRAKSSWSLPALEWIDALRETPRPLEPSRILVAGCGVGVEAFMLAKRFPKAQLVAVDFSERSIDIARKMLRTARLNGRLRFDVADLTSPDLAGATGDGFDLVTCHGVLSYVPDLRAVFRNFARLLSPDGLLLLGVNGQAHPSVRFRRMLPAFGIEPEKFEDGDHVRDVLRIFDSLIEYPPLPMADRPAGYLAGDIFGPLNHSLPVSEWCAMLDAAQLHLLGSYNAFFMARSLFNHDLHPHLMPRSRREMSELADDMQPSSFHQLVVSRRPQVAVPWLEPRRLFDWRPLRTRAYRFRWPRSRTASQNLRSVEMKSPPLRTKVELSIPQWEVDVLRAADGKRTFRELLAGVKPRVAPKDLAEAMYLLYQLMAVNVLPPEAE